MHDKCLSWEARRVEKQYPASGLTKASQIWSNQSRWLRTEIPTWGTSTPENSKRGQVWGRLPAQKCGLEGEAVTSPGVLLKILDPGSIRNMFYQNQHHQ